MSEEDKKAIQRCKELIKTEHSCWIGISNQLAIEKLLNIMQSQQKQIDLDNEAEIALNNKIIDLETAIEKLSNNNKRLLKKLRNRVKEVKKLTKYSLYKKEFSRLNKELEKKNKIIKQLKKENRELKIGTNNGLDKNKRNCFYEDGHTGKCLGYSFFNDDEPCIYCQTCETLSIKGDD